MSERYSRQIIIPQIGIEGQKKISRSSVFVAGVGGLGSPILTYLAAAGVGRLGFIDDDIVAVSNLNRQFLHNAADTGRAKTESAKEKLSALNDTIEINAVCERLTQENAADIFSGYDIVLGAVDSFDARFIINKACVSLCIPYIDGGINGFSGCVMFSSPPDTPCFNCVFPVKSAKKEAAGALGTTAGITGTIEANTALLYMLGLPIPLENKLLIYNGLTTGIEYIDIKRNEKCETCGIKQERADTSVFEHHQNNKKEIRKRK